MEPFSYHIGLFYSWVAWCYFMYTRGSIFDLGDFKTYWSERRKAAKIAELNFDVDRHRNLTRLAERYRRHIAAHQAITQ